MPKKIERLDPFYSQKLQEIVKMVGVERVSAVLYEMKSRDNPRVVIIRTSDLSAMTDLLTDAYMAFEDIAHEPADPLTLNRGGKSARARARARDMIRELRDWKPGKE